MSITKRIPGVNVIRAVGVEQFNERVNDAPAGEAADRDRRL
jgi:hypothetical protein